MSRYESSALFSFWSCWATVGQWLLQVGARIEIHWIVWSNFKWDRLQPLTSRFPFPKFYSSKRANTMITRGRLRFHCYTWKKKKSIWTTELLLRRPTLSNKQAQCSRLNTLRYMLLLLHVYILHHLKKTALYVTRLEQNLFFRAQHNTSKGATLGLRWWWDPLQTSLGVGAGSHLVTRHHPTIKEMPISLRRMSSVCKGKLDWESKPEANSAWKSSFFLKLLNTHTHTITETRIYQQ